MKKISFYVLLGFLGSCFFSCSKDFLTQNPEGSLNEGIFFNSVQDFDQALNGAYAPLRDIANEAYLMDECRTDNARYFYFAPDRGNNRTEKMTNYLTESDNGIVLDRYQYDYIGISRVNTILDKIKNINFSMDKSDKDRIIGESKALRAHYYFDLVKKFGGIPLFLQAVKKRDEAFKSRASVEGVYEQIISDLEDAIELLKEPTHDAKDIGRINKGVASTELGRVYLVLHKYSLAIKYLEPVTSMGYGLLNDYRKIFDPSNKGNKEMIFAVQYKSGKNDQGSEFVYDFTPIVTNTGPILGSDFNNTQGGWDVPTENLMNLFISGDSRFHASVGVFVGNLNSGDPYDISFTSNSEKNIVSFSPPNDPSKGVRYFARKFYYPPYPEENLKTSQNWPIYRYSGVLLMLAECYNESDQDRDIGKSLGYLNRVRRRAFNDSNHDITVSDKDNLRIAIRKERRRELVFENKRYEDLIRTGKAVQVMNAFGDVLKQKYNYLIPQSYNVTKVKLLYPIPFEEMELNDKLTQNPGY